TVRVEKPLAVEMIGTRAVVIARHCARIIQLGRPGSRAISPRLTEAASAPIFPSLSQETESSSLPTGPRGWRPPPDSAMRPRASLVFPPSPRLRGEGWGERLSWRSSDFWLPWTFVSEDRIEDSEELSRNSNKGDELWFAGGDEPVAEQLEGWIVTARHHGGDEQNAADAFSATANEALAAPLAGLAGPGRQADQRGDLAAIERTEFGQFGNEGAGDDGPDAGNGGEQILLFRPDRRATHLIVDRVIEFGQLFFHGLAQPRDALAQALVGQTTLALAL